MNWKCQGFPVEYILSFDVEVFKGEDFVFHDFHIIE